MFTKTKKLEGIFRANRRKVFPTGSSTVFSTTQKLPKNPTGVEKFFDESKTPHASIFGKKNWSINFWTIPSKNSFEFFHFPKHGSATWTKKNPFFQPRKQQKSIIHDFFFRKIEPSRGFDSSKNFSTALQFLSKFFSLLENSLDHPI